MKKGVLIGAVAAVVVAVVIAITVGRKLPTYSKVFSGLFGNKSVESEKAETEYALYIKDEELYV